MKALNTFLLIVIIGIPGIVNGQDANYTQFYNNPVYYNPANAALEDGLHLRTSYRKLWPQMAGDFRNSMLTMDVAEPALNGGIGFIIHSGEEGMGTVRENSFAAMYSYRLPVIPEDFYLQLGLQAAAVEKHIHDDDLVFSDQLDPVLGDVYPTNYKSSAKERVIYPDFSTGITSRFNLGRFPDGSKRSTTIAGVSFSHITRPNESFYGDNGRKPVKIVAHLHSEIYLVSQYKSQETIALAPGMVYENQEVFETFSTGLNLILDPIYAGFWMRNKNVKMQSENYDSVMMLFGIKTNLRKDVRLNIGYSYDIIVSELGPSTAGSHEITMSLGFDNVSLFRKHPPSVEKNNQYKPGS